LQLLVSSAATPATPHEREEVGAVGGEDERSETRKAAMQNGNGNTQMDAVIDSMRSIVTETDRWKLAEALKAAVPSGGNDRFGEIVDKATAEGVIGGLSANTLRLYRDTACRWPDASTRIPNISFSAHREVLPLGATDGRKLLEDMVRTSGPAKVTVAAVRKNVKIKQGQRPAVPAPPQPAQPGQMKGDVLVDLQQGGPHLIAAIGNLQDDQMLDQLHAGLQKVIGHVEKLRAKANRKANATKARTPAAEPQKPAAQPQKPAADASRKAGDLRGL
jgi:hypothetical protein